MFNVEKFSKLLQQISNKYDSITSFADISGVNRTYLSKYINMKLDTPPSPKVLQKLAKASNGLTNYEELMIICGYLDNSMKFEELFKNIFNKYAYTLKDLNISNDLYNLIYKMTTSSPEKYSKQFDKLVSKLPTKTQEKVLNIQTMMLHEVSELMEKSIDSISLRTKYDIEDNIINKYYMCPVYGRISAGQPNWAEECIEGRFPIDVDLMNIINPEECFFLKVNGESMNKEIQNGAYALIRKTDFVENGDIAVVLVNGFDATLKKFSKQGELIILEPMSNDPTFTTQVYDKNTEVKVIGKYIGKMEIND